MAYEYSLRRLFQPPVDHLPLSEQLEFYNQRSLAHSHVYRLGNSLFGGHAPTIRRRCIDAAHYTAVQRTPHAAYLQTQQKLPTEREGYASKPNTDSISPPVAKPQAQTPLHWFSMKSSEVGDNGRLHTTPDDASEVQYNQWLAHRRDMRSKLNGLGASRRWLLSKDCTPLENKLLTQLNEKQKASDSHDSKHISLPEVITESSSPVSLTQNQPSRKKRQLTYKMQMLKEITLLEQFLAKYRLRLVQLLTSADRKHNLNISVSDMLSVINKLKVPLSQAAVELLLRVLVIDDDGHLNYQQLLNGEILKAVEAYFEKESALADKASDSNKDREPVVSTSSEYNLLHLNKPVVQSTLGGEKGELADAYKEEELRQFKALVECCKASGIVLDWKLAEKALLLPQDHTKKKCKSELRQPGLSLLSAHFADPPPEESEKEEERIKLIYEGFGKHYRELRGRRKERYQALSTGRAMVKAKTDCWLTFKEYQRLTEHIRSKPGFSYKDHGLPDNNAFWPGALLDKLRLWMPDAKLNNPISVQNLFQPVDRTKFSNPQGPVVEQRISWTENERGYVQFGSQNRKQYQL